MKFIVWKNNQQIGPYSEENIRQYIKTGDLSEEDLVWTDGQLDWLPAGKVIPKGVEDKLLTNKLSGPEVRVINEKSFTEKIFKSKFEGVSSKKFIYLALVIGLMLGAVFLRE